MMRKKIFEIEKICNLTKKLLKNDGKISCPGEVPNLKHINPCRLT